MIPSDERDQYTQLMAMSRESFAGRHYAVAYHELMAALHLANDVGSMAQIQEVATVAVEQQSWLATHDPENRRAPNSAARWGYPGIYSSLINQAAMMQSGLRLRRAKEKLRAK